VVAEGDRVGFLALQRRVYCLQDTDQIRPTSLFQNRSTRAISLAMKTPPDRPGGRPPSPKTGRD